MENVIIFASIKRVIQIYAKSVQTFSISLVTFDSLSPICTNDGHKMMIAIPHV